MLNVSRFDVDSSKSTDDATNITFDTIANLDEAAPENTDVSHTNLSSQLSIAWSDNGPVHHFWPEDIHCSKFSTRFAVKNSLPTRALASYPGSGNTWTRYLVEAASGVFTGSVFIDESILKAGHYGEGHFKDGSTILQKTHNMFKKNISDFQGRGVVLVRNPYKAIMASWNIRSTLSHTETINSETLTSKQFRAYVGLGGSRWLKIITDWVGLGNKVYFMFYEDLVDDLTEEIRNLLNFLKLSVDEERLKCIERHSEGIFHRTKHLTDDPFSANDHDAININIEIANRILKEKTGRELPLKKYELYTLYEDAQE